MKFIKLNLTKTNLLCFWFKVFLLISQIILSKAANKKLLEENVLIQNINNFKLKNQTQNLSANLVNVDFKSKKKSKTFYEISRDGRHQMLAFGSEITLASQIQQLTYENANPSIHFKNTIKFNNSIDENEIETSAQEIFPFFFNSNLNLCPKPNIRCFLSKYRSSDGSCNNLQNPRWGKSFECYKRILNPDYGDDFITFRTSLNGNELPNARLISSVAHTGRSIKSKDVSNMLMQWGQFLDHDLTQTPSFMEPNGNLVDCCNGPFRPDRCAPIQILRGDDFYLNFGTTCLNFVRSSPCLTCSTSQRTQLNQLTSFIDASNIYGSIQNHTNSLRLFDGTGRLSMSNNELLPSSFNPRTDQCSLAQSVCFASGDSRVNLTPGLTSMHTIWHRQHNSIALGLKSLNPHWDDERLFQETRRIVGAQMQMITYNEFLPLIIGISKMQQFDLLPKAIGSNIYTRYNPNSNPSISTEFATAAFRFGHTLISPVYSTVTSNGRSNNYFLKDNYFNPHTVRNGDLDNILRGMISLNAARSDPFIVDDVRNYLYKKRSDNFGSDLIAFNIQRGRDHGLPGYIHFMRTCFNERINSFEQLDSYMPTKQRLKLQRLYSHVQDIDLFTGGISEYPLKDARVGPTFACIIGRQFSDLKFGDRFYFEHAGESGEFNQNQLNSIKNTILSKVICNNADNIKQITPKAMQVISDKNPIVFCNNLPNLDLSFWKE